MVGALRFEAPGRAYAGLQKITSSQPASRIAGPLKLLRWCRNLDRKVRQQVEACGPGYTEVHDISAVDPNAKVAFDRVSKAYDAAANPVSSATNGRPSNEEILRSGRMSVLKLLGFAFVFGLVAKLMQRSFLFWFFIGAITEMILVGADLMPY
jgi:hypothetical protein